MPIYEYGCDRCGHEFEAEQRITEAPLKSCPDCRSRKVRRLISRTSFVLKGSGWYSDLYASPGAAKKEAPAASDSGDSTAGEARSEAKPTPAGDAKPKASEAGKKAKKGPKAAA